MKTELQTKSHEQGPLRTYEKVQESSSALVLSKSVWEDEKSELKLKTNKQEQMKTKPTKEQEHPQKNHHHH